jgi:hypothetical protein
MNQDPTRIYAIVEDNTYSLIDNVSKREHNAVVLACPEYDHEYCGVHIQSPKSENIHLFIISHIGCGVVHCGSFSNCKHHLGISTKSDNREPWTKAQQTTRPAALKASSRQEMTTTEPYAFTTT